MKTPFFALFLCNAFALPCLADWSAPLPFASSVSASDRFVAASAFSEVAIFDAKNGALVERHASASDSFHPETAVSSTGRWAAWQGAPVGTVQLADWSKGTLTEIRLHANQNVFGLAFSPDEAKLAIGGHFGEAIEIWDISGTSPRFDSDRVRREGPYGRIEWLDDRRLLFNNENIATLGDWTTGLVSSLTERGYGYGDVVRHPASGILAFSGGPGSASQVRVWDPALKAELATFATRYEVAGATPIAFGNASCPRFAHLESMSTIRIRRIDGNFGVVNTVRIPAQVGNLVSVAFTPDCRSLAMAGDGGVAVSGF